MKIVIASDSYKGSLSTVELANIIEKGIKGLESTFVGFFSTITANKFSSFIIK